MEAANMLNEFDVINKLSLDALFDDIKLIDEKTMEFKSKFNFHESKREEAYYIIETNGRLSLSDKGSTLSILDDIFMLEEPNVIKNIDAILNQYNIRKVGSELSCELFPSICIATQVLRYLQGINFLLAMKLFYT
jgi:hypothetical protein